MTEQRYKAVLAVIGDGRTVDEVARDWGVSRRTMHRWLARYEGDGLEGLNNRSHQPAHCPHQTSPAVEAMVLEMRRAHSYWGARRIALELARKRVEPAPSESAVYRCLVRTAVIDPMTRRRRRETWTKRRPMTLLNFMVPVWLRRVGLPDSMPNDWTWQQGDVSFRLDAPQSKEREGAKSGLLDAQLGNHGNNCRPRWSTTSGVQLGWKGNLFRPRCLGDLCVRDGSGKTVP